MQWNLNYIFYLGNKLGKLGYWWACVAKDSQNLMLFPAVNQREEVSQISLISPGLDETISFMHPGVSLQILSYRIPSLWAWWEPEGDKDSKSNQSNFMINRHGARESWPLFLILPLKAIYNASRSTVGILLQGRILQRPKDARGAVLIERRKKIKNYIQKNKNKMKFTKI